MSRLDIKKNVEVDTNASAAWDIIGPKFIHISNWARGVSKSWDDDSVHKDFENAPTGGRHCEVSGFGRFDEKITHFDGNKHEITWEATGEKIPKFIHGLHNEIKVEELDEKHCRIVSNISADLSGVVGFLLGFFVKMNFSKTLDGFLEDWKVYAETGHVSETKKKEMTG